MGAVDVEPDSALGAERPDRFEVVEGAGGRRAGGGHDGHHLAPGFELPVQLSRQRLRVHPEAARRDGDGVVGA